MVLLKGGGRASARLIGGLVEASHRPGVREIIVASMPHRVHGAPVAADFTAAVTLSAGRPVTVRTATSIDYRDLRGDTLDGPPQDAIRRTPSFAEVRLRIEEGRFSRYVRPRPPAGRDHLETGWATILFAGAAFLTERLPDVWLRRWIAWTLEDRIAYHRATRPGSTS